MIASEQAGFFMRSPPFMSGAQHHLPMWDLIRLAVKGGNESEMTECPRVPTF